MKIEILKNLHVLVKERAERDDSNPLIIQTSQKMFWRINVDETIKNIERELKTYRRYGDLENFHEGMSYSVYLKKLRAHLQMQCAKVLPQREHST